MPTQDRQARITPLLGEPEMDFSWIPKRTLADAFASVHGLTGCSGVAPELHFQPGSGNLADVIPGWSYPMYEKQEK